MFFYFTALFSEPTYTFPRSNTGQTGTLCTTPSSLIVASRATPCDLMKSVSVFVNFMRFTIATNGFVCERSATMPRVLLLVKGDSEQFHYEIAHCPLLKLAARANLFADLQPVAITCVSLWGGINEACFDRDTYWRVGIRRQL